MKRTFEQARSFLTQAALSESLEEREAVIAEVRRDSGFFEGYSPDQVWLLQGIWSDVINGAREIALARGTTRGKPSFSDSL
ncbi:hypothetical protein [Meiothermus granaticius]|uniref:hypothetical protein n=1 Tax=Meiothermus granaticius TaxID=863370 RepID=UPI0011BFC739|nr:hypothetical protein [Meiothermus granaticius]